jgi:hypothetical protein
VGAPGQPKTGGRQKGTPNRSTSARAEAMACVNRALAAIGEDALTGMKLLQEVLNHEDTPLDVKIQCAGLLVRQEAPAASEQQYIAHMPFPLRGETSQQQLAVWLALHDQREDDSPEWTAACKRVLELAAHRKRPETLSWPATMACASRSICAATTIGGR